ncbi:hypothetical protein JIN84_12170 [Luteolibacter yonseiensis]|uniref:Outer membrane protein beta-barrel domain-containing protein n=1 Tax=Luteolibacter yonseiensis TaxID=1144680 RepID=A0A934R5J6_9BACT|nr:hypothetical protein [Luteolibacter yonseiensis]MBK1816373.1 hypothetical protein [Luteolibacter yonseiensis]
MKKLIFSSFILPALLSANATASQFSYTHLDLGYLNGSAETPVDEIDLDLEGFVAKGRIQIAEGFFGYLGYEDGEIETDANGIPDESLDTLRLTAGLGGYGSICDSADVYYGIGYKYTELETSGIEQELGNIDLHVGIRWAPTSWLEVNPHLEQSFGVSDDDLDAVDTTTIGLNLYVTAIDYVKPFAGISYELDTSDDSLVEDTLLYSVGLRLSF